LNYYATAKTFAMSKQLKYLADFVIHPKGFPATSLSMGKMSLTIFSA
jgi:hypothetical protein